MKKILLHICCGVCAFAAIKELKDKDFQVEGFFFNPNIYPYPEYLRRRTTAGIVAKELKVKMSEGSYLASGWFNLCQKYENQAEGRRRCSLCYEFRLKETFNLALKKGFDYFTTTLSISPHKDSLTINRIGKNIDSEKFLAFDFKKNQGFKKSLEAAKKLNLYRQNYCGCIYSKR